MDMKSLVPWRRNRTDMVRQNSNTVPIFDLHRQMNRLFDDFFQDLESPLVRRFAADWPALEVSDDDKAVRIVAELPGLDEKDIDVSLRDGILTIKGEKTSEKKEGSVYSERWHGQFSRSIDVGQEVDPEKIKASFDKGVLTVVAEKRPNAAPEVKKIAISKH